MDILMTTEWEGGGEEERGQGKMKWLKTLPQCLTQTSKHGQETSQILPKISLDLNHDVEDGHPSDVLLMTSWK